MTCRLHLASAAEPRRDGSRIEETHARRTDAAHELEGQVFVLRGTPGRCGGLLGLALAVHGPEDHGAEGGVEGLARCRRILVCGGYALPVLRESQTLTWTSTQIRVNG